MNESHRSRLHRPGTSAPATVEVIEPSDDQIESTLQDKRSMLMNEPTLDHAYWAAKLEEAKGLVSLSERNMLQTALDESNGEPTKAARLLGTTHQGFIYRLSKYQGVKRTEVKKRRSSQMVKG